MRNVLKVWFADDDEPTRPNMPVMPDGEVAAEVFCERYRDEDERPESYFVNVRGENGALERFEVHVEWEPSFFATKLPDVRCPDST